MKQDLRSAISEPPSISCIAYRSFQGCNESGDAVRARLFNPRKAGQRRTDIEIRELSNISSGLHGNPENFPASSWSSLVVSSIDGDMQVLSAS
jgi:hypothetical protein